MLALMSADPATRFWNRDRIIKELQEKNVLLENANEKLATLVSQRTDDLEIRNQALKVSQNVLNALSVAVLGIDTNQMIVLCNESARTLFAETISDPLGCHREEILGPELNHLLDSLKSNQHITAKLSLNNKNYLAQAKHLNDPDMQGYILELNQEIESDPR